MSGKLQADLFAPRWSKETFASTAARAREKPFDPFLAHHAETLRAAGPNRLRFDEDRWDYVTPGAVGIDAEVYKNFFLLCLKRFKDGTRITFERSDRGEDFDPEVLRSILANNLLVSFNGESYDLIIIYLAMRGADPEYLKRISDQIIKGEQRAWDTWRQLGVKPPRWQHVDVMEPNPSVRQGLKMLHGRLHGRFLVDLPFAPEARLTPEQMNVTTLYCFNDLDATQGVYEAIREPLELRRALGKNHGLELLSKSDAQVGEAIVKKGVEQALGRKVERSTNPITDRFRYEIPDFITFETPRLRAVLEGLRETAFRVNGLGKIDTPPLLEDLTIELGTGRYAMGIGGLHSTEAHRALRSDSEHQLIDVDVASQYPNIILKLGLYPKALGPKFLDVYREIVETRLKAKALMLELADTMPKEIDPAKLAVMKTEYSRAKVGADGGRVAANGVYGKLGSAFSPLYAPHLVIAVTLTGQLSILMLIERAEAAGIPVVSANTDGVVFYCPKTKSDQLDALLLEWEGLTGFSIERTKYAALYNSSVNVYIAVKEKGGAKRKGFIADPWSEGDLRGQMSKNPQAEICSEAVLQYLLKNVSLEETIRTCNDPRAFVSLIKVAEGGTWRGFNLGRAVRYYWSEDGDPILTAKTQKRVSKTEGAKPMMELTEVLPSDIDYLRYCEEAARLARDLGISIR